MGVGPAEVVAAVALVSRLPRAAHAACCRLGLLLLLLRQRRRGVHSKSTRCTRGRCGRRFRRGRDRWRGWCQAVPPPQRQRQVTCRPRELALPFAHAARPAALERLIRAADTNVTGRIDRRCLRSTGWSARVAAGGCSEGCRHVAGPTGGGRQNGVVPPRRLVTLGHANAGLVLGERRREDRLVV